LTQKHARIGVVIPVYGESDSVYWVMSRFKKGSVNLICLVVDAPLRQVMGRIRETAKKTGITVHIIKNRRRTGVGSSLRQGLRYLQKQGVDIAVIVAGNGKDDPSEIDRLVSPILAGECEYVQGSRYLPGGQSLRIPFVRSIFNRVYPLIWSLFTGRRCTEVTNGYRSFMLMILKDRRINLDQHWLNGYSLEYYLHYKVLSLGYGVREAPVSKSYPFNNSGGYSKIQPLKDWWPIISPLMLLFLGVRK
jgi:dolichol-phosphate mannosyltransferase